MGSRVLAFTGADQIVELQADGSWTVIADPVALPPSELGQAMLEVVGDYGLVAVGYDEIVFPEIAGEEPLTTARALWFSEDGAVWHTISVEGSFGTYGALEMAVLDDRLVVGFGPEQPEDPELITEPEWWIGTFDG